MNSSPDLFAGWHAPAPAPGAAPRPLGRRRPRTVAAWNAPRWDRPGSEGLDETPVAPAADDAERDGAYDDGLREGLRRGVVERQSAVQAMTQATRALVELREKLAEQVEANVAALAMAVARHLVLREMTVDPAILRELVSRGLEQIKPEGPVTVRLHPGDYAEMEAELERLATLESGPVRWQPDESVGRGGFVMETPRRLVDGRVEDSLRRLYERLVYE